MKEEEMTKSKSVAVSAMALMCVAEGMANPLAFPTYTQTVNVNYRSAEEAESAEV